MSMSRKEAKRIDRSLQRGDQIISTEVSDTSKSYSPSTDNENYDSGRWESWDPDEEIYDSETLGDTIEAFEQIDVEKEEETNYDLMGSGGDFEFRDRYYPWLE